MAFTMTSAPQVSPFTPAPAQRQAALAPMQAPATLKPTANTSMPRWFQAVGKTAKGIAADAEAEVRAASTSGMQPAGPWHPKALKSAVSDPAGTFERYSGMSMDEAFDEMGKVYGEEIPTDLTKQERGMLLMQLGFGIMSGGPGLAQALGQSGMSMMGTWHDLRRDKERKGEASKRARIDALGVRANIAARAEEGDADRAARVEAAKAKASAPVKMRPGDSMIDPATRQPIYTAPAAAGKSQAPYTDVGKLNADLAAGRITQEQHDKALASGAGAEPLRIQREAQYVAQLYGISEADAHKLNTLSAESRLNPEKTKQDLLRATLSANGGRADRAIVEAEKAMEWLNGNAAKAQDQAPEPPSPGALATLLNMLPGGGETAVAAPQPEVTGPIMPAVGAIEDGHRYKGGDPSKPESWEPIAAGR